MESHESAELIWRTSSHSMTDGSCVTISRNRSKILVKDTKDPEKIILLFDFQTWRTHTRLLKEGT